MSEITWEDVVDAADKALAELAELMNSDPRHGTLYQQYMAVMMFRRQEAIAALYNSQSDCERSKSDG